MKPLIAFVACIALAACGGGSTPTTLPASPGTSGATSTASLTLRVPASLVASGAGSSAAVRSAQYISPGTYSFFVDLQTVNGSAAGSTAFDVTLSLNTTACTADPSTAGWDVCVFQITEPVGVDTLSIAAAGADQGLHGSEPPPLLGYTKTSLTVGPGTQASPPTFVLDAIASAGTLGNSHLGLQYGYAGTVAPATRYPWLSYVLDDASNASIDFNQSSSNVQLLNPVSVTETGDTTGDIALTTLSPTAPGDPDAATPLTNPLTSLTKIDGFGIADTLTGNAHSAFTVTLTIPPVTLTDKEFPQIDSFPGTPSTAWTAPGMTSILSLSCGANTNSPTTNPCVAGN